MKQKTDELAKSASIERTTEHMEILLEGKNTRDPLETPTRHMFTIDFEDEGWVRPITQYLVSGNLLADPQKARSIRLKAVRYSIVGGQLYRRSTIGLMLRCVGPIEAQKLIEEIHEGDLNKDRTIGIISRNKMLSDGPRKCTRRIELHNKMLASRLQ
ncbi:hypothetical protein PanWU01x14_160540 [Parasponia andersonii]|uniref:Uncharacterized protein n=1 Tax=Parasponia andersonii TaxID=3476 RepID=A0A2P5CE73_PARAD|nr:hypothetical protein PanWU01x14_160540 [Parasponia andersonii]